MTNFCYVQAPIGKIYLSATPTHITHLNFEGQTLPEGFVEGQTPLLQEAARQLTAYFAGTLHNFTLPIAPEGTDFRRKVWQQLCCIPYGETTSYGALAAAIGNPKASRAVGGANHHNPIAIIIPCHRVIGNNGDLTGFGGGLATKAFLLQLEAQHK